ncbi:MAG: glycoside hydrolase family 3 protein [Treponema sp.]|jgi:beta-N-acetylhexosaminidase|nr:glycoside hydrolase family 3 protein [Treponema sp.]
MKRLYVFALSLCIAGCGLRLPGKGKGAVPEPVKPSGVNASAENTTTYLPGSDDLSYSRYRKEAARIAASLDDSLLAAQVLITGLDGNNYLGDEMKAILKDVPSGGIMLFRYNLNSGKDEIKSFLDECSSYVASLSGITPFMAVDHEGGLVHRFNSEVEKLPPAASYWDTALEEGWEKALGLIECSARRSALEIHSLGITMNFAPVAEVLDEKNALFIETRSYGPDSDFVRDAASAFIRGMDAAGIACVIKHFPGNTEDDPHFNAPVLNADKITLDRMTGPFAGIIGNLRPPCLMVSHALVPVMDSRKIASLSHRILKGWLRDEIGFEGVIIADDFSMEAAARASEQAAVEALAAGADMVMAWPSNARAVHRAVMKALEENSLSRERLLEAAGRILTEKLRYGIVPTEAGESGQARPSKK